MKVAFVVGKAFIKISRLRNGTWKIKLQCNAGDSMM